MTYPAQRGFYFAPISDFTIPEETPTAADHLELMEVYQNPDPEAQCGLRPTISCAARLLWFRDSRIAELEQFAQRDHPTFTNRVVNQTEPVPPPSAAHMAGLIAAAEAENPARIEQTLTDYLKAAQWEKTHFGNVAAILRPRRIYV